MTRDLLREATVYRPRMSRTTEVTSVLLALAALTISAASYRLAHRSDSRVDRQDTQQVAAKVFLSEAPPYADAVHPRPVGRTQWVVLNTSPAPISEVWVEGVSNRSVKIQDVSGCTMYALPSDFRPIAVNFKDEHGNWRREAGAAPRVLGQPMPARDTDDSPWFYDVRGC